MSNVLRDMQLLMRQEEFDAEKAVDLLEILSSHAAKKRARYSTIMDQMEQDLTAVHKRGKWECARVIASYWSDVAASAAWGKSVDAGQIRRSAGIDVSPRCRTALRQVMQEQFQALQAAVRKEDELRRLLNDEIDEATYWCRPAAAACGGSRRRAS